MRDSWDNMFEEVPASFEARMREMLSALEEKPKIRRFRFGTGALVAAALLVAVLGGTEGNSLFMPEPVTKEDLEAFAELFDFAKLG